MFFFLKENRLLVTLELIDTLELPESDSDEDEEQESCNVVALPDWADFLKKSGVNYVRQLCQVNQFHIFPHC
jgi:hypothetical protein